MRNLQHENILRFMGACVEVSHVCVLYEYCKKGTLEVGIYINLIHWKTFSFNDRIKQNIQLVKYITF